MSKRLPTAGILAAGAAALVIAVATGKLRLGGSGAAPSKEQVAQQRCESDVLRRLVARNKATISDTRTETAALDADGRDFSPLNTGDRLKGVETSRITVLNVSGMSNSPSEVGSTLRDHFDCRAYFVGGDLVDTLVVFDHDH